MKLKLAKCLIRHTLHGDLKPKTDLLNKNSSRCRILHCPRKNIYSGKFSYTLFIHLLTTQISTALVINYAWN